MRRAASFRKVFLATVFLGCSALLAVGCYKESNYSPTAPQVAGALTLTVVGGSSSIPADGLSQLTLVGHHRRQRRRRQAGDHLHDLQRQLRGRRGGR